MIYDIHPFLNADYKGVGVACGCESEPDLVQSCVTMCGGMVYMYWGEPD